MYTTPEHFHRPFDRLRYVLELDHGVFQAAAEMMQSIHTPVSKYENLFTYSAPILYLRNTLDSLMSAIGNHHDFTCEIAEEAFELERAYEAVEQDLLTNIRRPDDERI